MTIQTALDKALEIVNELEQVRTNALGDYRTAPNNENFEAWQRATALLEGAERIYDLFEQVGEK